MRTWTLVAAGLVVASAGTAAAVLPDTQPANTQQEQRDRTPATEGREADGLAREVQRRFEMWGEPEAQIGVTIRDLEGNQAREMRGALVSEVRPDSPADKAGLQDGDIIVEFDGEKVRSARQLSRMVGETPTGRSVTTGVLRGGTRLDLQVTPEAGMASNFHYRLLPNRDFDPGMPGFRFDGPRMPERFDQRRRGAEESESTVMPRRRGRLGIGIQDLSPQLAEYFGTKGGVLVTTVEEDSPAARAGLEAGDVITAIGNKPVGSPSDLARAVGRADAGLELSITYTRNRKSATATATLEQREREPVQRKGAPI